MTSTIAFTILLRVLGITAVWFKSNAKAVFGIDHGFLFWWFTIGWAVEYAFLESWWQLSSEIGPYKASVVLATVGTLTTVILMTIFYGFNLKYIISMAFLLCAGVVMRL